MAYSVYIDILFFVNLMINTIILMASAVILRIKYSCARVFAGAAVGALYACVIFFPKIHIIYTFAARASAAALICFIAFAPKGVRQCVKQTVVFYITTAVFGVISLALLYFTDIGIRLGGVISNGVFYFNIPITYLVLSCAVAYASISAADKFFRKRALRSYTDITVFMGGKSVELKALVDTGNMLRDPLSGKTVMIAEAKVMAPLFEFDIGALSDGEGEYMSLPPGFRLIPFSSIGKSSGILVAFVPEKIIINNSERTNIIAAVYNSTLSKSREYNALLNPEAL